MNLIDTVMDLVYGHLCEDGPSRMGVIFHAVSATFKFINPFLHHIVRRATLLYCCHRVLPDLLG